MNIRCPECGQEFEVADHLAGKKGRCGACNAVFRIPEAAADSSEDYGLDIPFETVVQTRPVAPPPFRAARDIPDRPDEVETELSPGLKILQFIAYWLPGLFRPKVLVFGALCCIAAVVLFGMAMFFMRLGALLVAAPVGGFGLICYGQALAMVLTGEMGFLSSLLAELNSTRWLLFFFALFTPILLLILWLSHMRA